MNDLEKLKKTWEMSTKGEWKLVWNNVLSDNRFVAGVLVEGDNTAKKNERLANAEFIILAHKMMPEILADIERLQVVSNELKIAEYQITHLKEALKLSTKTKLRLKNELKQMEKYNSSDVLAF